LLHSVKITFEAIGIVGRIEPDEGGLCKFGRDERQYLGDSDVVVPTRVAKVVLKRSVTFKIIFGRPTIQWKLS
jgi:hypothetical protein